MIALSGPRAIAERYMTDAADVARYSETNTADGPIQSWQTIATGLACAVWPIGTAGAEREGPGAVVRALSEWTVRLPALSDVTVRDRLVVTMREGGAVRTFEVTRVDSRTYEVARDCICALLS